MENKHKCKHKFIDFCEWLRLLLFDSFDGKVHPACVSLCISATYARAPQVALVVKNLPGNAGDIRDLASIPRSGRSPGGIMATHSRILAWRIPWTEEPGGLQSIGLQRVRHNWSNLAHTHATYASWPSITQSLLSKWACCRSPTFTNLRLTPTSPRGSRRMRTHSNAELQDMEQESITYSFDEITCDICKLRNNGHIDFVNSIFRPCFKMTCMPIGK